MIKVYVLPNHPTSHFAKEWFEKNKISYQLRVVTDNNPLTEEEIMNMIYITVDINDLISRADVWKGVNMEDMCLKSELIPFIQKNPRALKFPIVDSVIDITTGYSLIDYERFLPRVVRKRRFVELLKTATEL